jgi:hypothetical protein
MLIILNANHQKNANQNTMRHHLTLIRMAIIKNLKIMMPGKDVEKRQPLKSEDNNVNQYSYYGK